MSYLERLQRTVDLYARSRRLVSICGVVVEVAPSYFRAEGLSKFVRLGDCVSVESGRSETIAQVVRVDKAGTVLKSFENTGGFGLGAPVRWVARLKYVHMKVGRGAS